jgi:hypothetical protein
MKRTLALMLGLALTYAPLALAESNATRMLSSSIR